MNMHMKYKGELYIAICTHERHVHISGENHISDYFGSAIIDKCHVSEPHNPLISYECSHKTVSL